MISDEFGNSKFPYIYRGVVFDSRDPQNNGRIRVKVPQLLGSEPTSWAWPANPTGVVHTAPGVGEGVWVMFEGGDPSYPVWVATFGESTAFLDIDCGVI